MTVQLPSGNGVFPPRHRRDDSSDIKGQQSASWQGAFWPVSHWWPALLGTRPATTKQQIPEGGMVNSPPGLRACSPLLVGVIEHRRASRPLGNLHSALEPREVHRFR